MTLKEMAEKNNNSNSNIEKEKPSINPESSQDPPTPSLTTSSSSSSPSCCSSQEGVNNKKEEDSEGTRESKRRKNCPTALDQIQELASLNPTSSFTFDTKFSANTPEFTPKFGSFNMLVSNQEEKGSGSSKEGCLQRSQFKAEEEQAAEVGAEEEEEQQQQQQQEQQGKDEEVGDGPCLAELICGKLDK